MSNNETSAKKQENKIEVTGSGAVVRWNGKVWDDEISDVQETYDALIDLFGEILQEFGIDNKDMTIEFNITEEVDEK